MRSAPRVSIAGTAGMIALILLTLSALIVPGASLKVVAVGWIAFAAMAIGAGLGARSAANQGRYATNLVWGYGVASGAMITSAAIFVVPPALAHHPEAGGLGVAAGLVIGFIAHTIGHTAAHAGLRFDYTTTALTAHTLAAGAIIGVVYASLPGLGLLLGVAIVSHKAPAGYAAAKRLTSNDRSPTVLLLPAAGVGVAAITSNILTPTTTQSLNSLVFGFAAGIFLHVAMDFLPRCELGGDVYEAASVTDDHHKLLDRLRLHAVASTSLGVTAVVLAWAAV